MTNKNKKFCYRKVDFYETAYMGVFLTKGKEDNNKKMIWPLEPIYKELGSIKKEIMEIKLDQDKIKKNRFEIFGGIIIKIRFNRKSPLKKEFWTTKTKEGMALDYFYRMKQYLKMFDNGGERLYKIMVMPAFYDVKKKKWTLTNWLPVNLNITDEELGKIAIMSNKTQVDISAKNMALYKIEWIKGFDLDTGKFVKSQKEIDLEEANC
jgi:hypothetical protein